MSRRRTRNTRMTPARQRKKQFFAEVNARGGRQRLQKFSMYCGLFLRFSLVTALVCGVYFGVTRGWSSLFWQNPDYALQDITVKNSGSALTRDQVIAASGVQVGKNILSYTLSDIEAAVRKLPQVGTRPEDVTVNRYLPNRLEIHIVERKPVAWVVTKATPDYLTNPNAYLVDAEGAWFRPKQVLHEYETLPVISGVVTDNLQPDQVIRSAELLAALELIEKNIKTPRFQARMIDISRGYCMIVKDQSGALITFGLDDLDGQLARLDQARDAEKNLSQQIATVNVMLERNIPITWVPPLPPEETDFPPKPVDTAKPTTKDLKAKQQKKPEPKKVPAKEPKKPNPDSGLYKPFLLRA